MSGGVGIRGTWGRAGPEWASVVTIVARVAQFKAVLRTAVGRWREAKACGESGYDRLRLRFVSAAEYPYGCNPIWKKSREGMFVNRSLLVL